MLKKEIKDTLRVLLEASLVLALLPITYAGEVLGKWGFNFVETLDLVFPFFVGMYAIYGGLTVFRAEKGNDAFEYMLSWPLLKVQKLSYKVLPRLTVIMVLIGTAWVFSMYEQPGIAAVRMMGLFFIAMFMGLAIDSLMVGLLEVFCLWLMPVIVSNKLAAVGMASPLTVNLALFLILVAPMGVSFIMTFFNLEARALRYQLKYYWMFTTPMLLMALGYTVFLFAA